MAKTAILVDGGFYQMKAQSLFGEKTGKGRADELFDYCMELLKNKKGEEKDELYRIFYYDCPPLTKKVNHPLTQRQIDFSKTPLYKAKSEFLDAMMQKRKVALRLGRLAEEYANYIIKPSAAKRIGSGKLKIEDLQEDDFAFDVKQKGVDMKIGIDIASMAYKRQVDRIILIAGDSDFVPAAKLARREGIDFILDSMGNHINADLMEHIDGMKSKWKYFANREKKNLPKDPEEA